MFAIVKGTIHEAIAKKIILGFFALSTLIIFIFLVLVNIESIEENRYEMSVKDFIENAELVDSIK